MNARTDWLKRRQAAGVIRHFFGGGVSMARLLVCGAILGLMLAACSSPTPMPPSPLPTPSPSGTEASPEVAGQTLRPTIEEITFQSGEFTLVGDLRLPEGRRGPFPVVLFVHGDTPGANRTMFGMYLPIMERMLRAGYAVFSWDNPGAGESTGTTNRGQITQQQAQIVMDAIEVMKAHPDVDSGRIGLWGVSMAGWVMPRVLMASDDVAFMICQSCGSMSGDDEYAYLKVAQGYCGGGPEEDADQLEVLLAELDEARIFDTYEGYLRYREVLDELATLGSVRVPNPVVSEAAWLANDPASKAWSPMEVIEQVRIPVLAIWGDRDTKVDPIRAAYAYRHALEQAGNPNYRVEVISGVDHTLAPSETGCISQEGQTLERVLEEQGFTLEDMEALNPQDLPQVTLLSAWPYAPAYLDLIEEWLRGLPMMLPVQPVAPIPTPLLPGMVDVGGYDLFYTCRGQGSPTVILEAGGGGDSRSWAKVMSGVEGTTRICAYDRANLGRSDKAPKPRTMEDMTRDLSALLANAQIGGPYILVGHSLGGELVLVFADQHPEEAAGLVLVDSAHPDMGPRLLAGLPLESADEPKNIKFWRQLFTWISNSNGSEYPNPEEWDTQTSNAQVKATKPLGDLPLVVISQSPDKPLFAVNIPPSLTGTNAELQKIWQEMQKELTSLSSNSTRVIATQAGHDIPNEEPELVIEAIVKLVNEDRSH